MVHMWPCPRSLRPTIELRQVTVRFPTHSAGPQTILEQLDLTCGAGELLAVVGPSGCGKSTLLRVIAGLQPVTAGQLLFRASEGQVVAARPKVGFVFQAPNLLPWRSVTGNIGLPLELAHVDKPRRRELVEQARRLVGLAAADGRKLPRQLSGGMQMRVSLARALVTQPQVMLLDEPFAALDDMIRSELNEELDTLRRDQHWTTLFVTHNVSEAVYLADRILIMPRFSGTAVAPVLLELPWRPARPPNLRGRWEYLQVCNQVRQTLAQMQSGQPHRVET